MEDKREKKQGSPIILQGIVTEDVCYEKECSRYFISTGKKEYAIISSGKQAAKDNLFVRKGQHMEIKGSISPGETNLEITPDKSKILLNRM